MGIIHLVVVVKEHVTEASHEGGAITSPHQMGHVAREIRIKEHRLVNYLNKKKEKTFK